MLQGAWFVCIEFKIPICLGNQKDKIGILNSVYTNQAAWLVLHYWSITLWKCNEQGCKFLKNQYPPNENVMLMCSEY